MVKLTNQNPFILYIFYNYEKNYKNCEKTMYNCKIKCYN